MKPNWLSISSLVCCSMVLNIVGQSIHMPFAKLTIISMLLGGVWGLCWPVVEIK